MLVVLGIAYFAGGYVAGRMARFDGARQGVAVWIIGLLVVLLLAGAGAAFGAKYNVLAQLDLPGSPSTRAPRRPAASSRWSPCCSSRWAPRSSVGRPASATTARSTA
jgi:hypothetical protein